MRALSPSFRAALAAYRRAIVEKLPAGPELKPILKVLKRWDEHAGVETIWKTITEAQIASGLPPLEPAEFIEWLAFTRAVYEKHSDVIEQTPDVTAKLRAQADRDWKGLEEWPRAIARRAAVEAHLASMDKILGRKKAGAPRQRFMRMLRDTFLANCGRPLNDVVAMLTEIAFGPDTSADAVKNMRKRR